MSKTIVLGVSGSIAAYKAAELASRLVKEGYEVYPVLTKGATNFISPVTFSALCDKPCPSDIFDEPFPGQIAHIHLAHIADLFVIVPASMNMIARLASGMGDDMLTAAVSATKAPVLIAPSMNTAMWENPATQANVNRLIEYGYRFVDPAVGRLACKTVGIGKLAELDDIFDAIQHQFAEDSSWAGRSVLVTAGPTREAIDPVRYITNRSSGKMGYAIAEAAARRGGRVTLISGPVALSAPSGVETVLVTTAEEMREAVLSRSDAAECVFATAAVADYRPEQVSLTKIKKSDGDTQIALTRTPDILALLGQRKRPGQILAGFAAETDDLDAQARKKLETKNLDLVIANNISQNGAGFDVDTNIVTVYNANGSVLEMPILSKQEVASRLLDIVRPMLTD